MTTTNECTNSSHYYYYYSHRTLPISLCPCVTGNCPVMSNLVVEFHSISTTNTVQNAEQSSSSSSHQQPVVVLYRFKMAMRNFGKNQKCSQREMNADEVHTTSPPSARTAPIKLPVTLCTRKNTRFTRLGLLLLFLVRSPQFLSFPSRVCTLR